MIRLEALDRAEAVRYLGDARVQMNSAMEHLLDECEEQVLRVAEPKFLYKVKDLPCPGLMAGNDIAEHLAGCSKAVLLAATLGTGIDRMLRVEQVKDMSRAVVLDALASVAIEQVCRQFDEFLQGEFPYQGAELIMLRYSLADCFVRCVDPVFFPQRVKNMIFALKDRKIHIVFCVFESDLHICMEKVRIVFPHRMEQFHVLHSAVHHGAAVGRDDTVGKIETSFHCAFQKSAARFTKQVRHIIGGDIQ